MTCPFLLHVSFSFPMTFIPRVQSQAHKLEVFAFSYILMIFAPSADVISSYDARRYLPR